MSRVTANDDLIPGRPLLDVDSGNISSNVLDRFGEKLFAENFYGVGFSGRTLPRRINGRFETQAVLLSITSRRPKLNPMVFFRKRHKNSFSK